VQRSNDPARHSRVPLPSDATWQGELDKAEPAGSIGLGAADPMPGMDPAVAPATAPDGLRPTDPGRSLAVYAALDLGTNNCRLLVARPSRRGFVVIDAFSRIIRLGEGIGRTGRLSEGAMTRTIEALKICSDKMARRNVTRARTVATEACRVAANGAEFLDRVRRQAGIELEILTPESEARLALAGCISLIDREAECALVFDIGGGSSEIIFLDGTEPKTAVTAAGEVERRVADWVSLPVGVVTLSERFGGRQVTPEIYQGMVAHVAAMLQPFEQRNGIASRLAQSNSHLLGTSGTITTVAGIHLGLRTYDRARVDGCWLAATDVRRVSAMLIGSSYEQRVAQPCIGPERADLVLAGCAILEAMMQQWPCERLRVADRGLREGILSLLMSEDGLHRARHQRPRGSGRR
jgi:exopolyphosphatase / guanosine-5'-triphosphate,3'-diphosphate pyrophosphatase